MIAYTPTPILFAVGPLAIRYYSLAYLIGFLSAWHLLSKSALRKHADSLLLWIVLGVIVGGRLGEFIFYSPSTLWTDPLEVLKIWHGGMSFHGGLIGAVLAVWTYTRRNAIAFFETATGGAVERAVVDDGSVTTTCGESDDRVVSANAENEMTSTLAPSRTSGRSCCCMCCC